MSTEPSKGSDRYPPLFPEGNVKMVLIGTAIGSVFVALVKVIIGNLFGDLAAGVVLLVGLIVTIAENLRELGYKRFMFLAAGREIAIERPVPLSERGI